MNYYSIGEFANKLNITTQTLRNWDKEGKLKPHHVSDGKHRYYSEEQELVEDMIQIITVFSCRLQGKRANKAKKMIKELTEDD